jgi:hypothetical protein
MASRPLPGIAPAPADHTRTQPVDAAALRLQRTAAPSPAQLAAWRRLWGLLLTPPAPHGANGT